MKLELIEPEDKHYRQMYEWMNSDPEMHLYSCRESLKMPEYSIWMAKKLSEQNRKDIIVRALVDKDKQNDFLGRFIAFDYNPRNKNFEIGYYFPKENRGKGLGCMGLKLFIDFLSQLSFPVRKLTAYTSEKNVASQNILLRQGFKLDGRLRDHFEINGCYFEQFIYSYIFGTE